MRFIFMALLAFGLFACAPTASTLNNAALADGASLTMQQTGANVVITFASGVTDAQQVTVDIAGENLKTSDPRCAVGSSIGCKLGTINAKTETTIIITGQRISSNALFYRPGESAPRPVLGTVR
jgi:hypothetical protein